MASVNDVAAYILRRTGGMTAMKLQKLCYYSQAWHLVWEERSLFPEKIEAWANGPVCPDLYRMHRKMFRVQDGDIKGNASALTDEEKGSIDAVIDFYNRYSSVQLGELTHSEDPWRNARRGVEPGDRSNEVITDFAMAEFYEGLAA